MKDTEKIDDLRKQFLSLMNELAGLGIARASHLPIPTTLHALRSPDDVTESTQAVNRANKRIIEVCNQTRAVEQMSRGSLGIPAVFGEDLQNCLRIAVAVMVTKSLTGTCTSDCRYLGNLIQVAAGEIPDQITVRQAFERKGVLRPHILCEVGRTLDEFSNITLTESAFRKIAALDGDSECDELLRARALVAVSGRR